MGWTDDNGNGSNEQNEPMSEDNEDVDLSDLAPGAVSVDEAAEADHTWKVLWWGNESTGKSHACYTFPEPVCFIDTEHKADDIAHKFSNKTVQIWQPENFDEAVQARDEAFSYLSEYEAQTGQQGTIVVDSMADMWKWAQYKYIGKYYSNTDPEDVTLSLEDWGPIKQIHNEGFRQEFERCDYHVSWTAPRKDDLSTKIEEEMESTPDKPGGESDNVYKVNSIIRLQMNNDGIPIGDLQKSGVLQFKYLGLKRPTFPKHKKLVEHLMEIEENGAETVEDVEQAYSLDYDLYGFTEANTMRFIQ
jgi:hypothetical protein